MDNKQIKKMLKTLAKKYPLVSSVDFFYYGSGGSFDSYDVSFEAKNEGARDLINIDNKDFEAIFWEMINKVGSDFNDEGSEGHVIFDLENETVEITDYFFPERSSQLNTSITI